MFIYNGKLNWYHHADNENTIMVVPAGFALNDPICAYWQWTVNNDLHQAYPSQRIVLTGSLLQSSTINTFSFTFGYYSFDAIVASDFSTLTATMRNPKGDRSDPITLTRQYGDVARVPSTVVCTGNLSWFNYVENEMVTLVIPAGVSNDAPIGFHCQLSVDGTASGNEKKNYPVNATFHNVATSSNGNVSGTFDDYTFDATVLNGGQEATIRINRLTSEPTSSTTKQTDFRGLSTKKASEHYTLLVLPD
ncbi:hypothetical protein IW261DRAFT_1336689 [Armillaria novae-zelandiae]|uniref:Uncharacterized protein n=1 Tax=Armillaria novae-zelandiae TaxID=153914 RepID=A0AA39P8K3_9AGAR|nr:hypothetical protein IW261DRAFT_1336689 [Armillaria novae-zelandiae]